MCEGYQFCRNYRKKLLKDIMTKIGCKSENRFEIDEIILGTMIMEVKNDIIRMISMKTVR